MQKIIYKYDPNFFEHEAWKNNNFVCGIVEVGRGSLVGPVVTAAVILNINAENSIIKDSKILSDKQKNEAYKWIVNNSIFSTAYINHNIIDKVNIYNATIIAMKRALNQLLLNKNNIPLKYILIDSIPLNIETKDRLKNTEIISFNYGEKFSISIAAASIIAKVTRDNIMRKLDINFKEYDLKNNKGYCIDKHKDIIKLIGKSIIHRDSFLINGIDI
jgi:ribonuclease HII